MTHRICARLWILILALPIFIALVGCSPPRVFYPKNGSVPSFVNHAMLQHDFVALEKNA